MKATGKIFIISAMASLLFVSCNNRPKEATEATEPEGYSKEQISELKTKAEAGDADAQCELGLCYGNGYGVPQNYEEAVKWYRMAVEKGDANAQYNLGVCYAYGWGVTKDYEEAAKWWTKAAEQGDADAQYRLGVCYYNGTGVEQNYAEAVKWWTRAAEQGHADAQNSLGNCYYYGYGVEKNYVEAAKWYTKAAAQGDKDAQKALNAKKALKGAKSDGTINDHEYVDLGLSVKWATCNVGADSLAGKGDYYAWGEITPKEDILDENYTKNSLNKDITGNPNYDAATAKWGRPWRMPTKDEMIELIENTITDSITINGVKGLLVKSKKNGKTIFLPDAAYWSSSLCNESRAYSLAPYYFGGKLYWDWDYRWGGENIRPVADKNRNDKICDAYLEKVKEYDLSVFSEHYYSLFDITNNGIPELLVDAGTCNADYTIFVYTYENNGLREIGQFFSSNSDFYFNKKGHYVVQIYSHGDHFLCQKHIYDGRKIKSTIFFDANGYGEIEAAEKKYKKEIEATPYDEADHLKWFKCSDTEPILKMFD